MVKSKDILGMAEELGLNIDIIQNGLKKDSKKVESMIQKAYDYKNKKRK